MFECCCGMDACDIEESGCRCWLCNSSCDCVAGADFDLFFFINGMAGGGMSTLSTQLRHKA